MWYKKDILENCESAGASSGSTGEMRRVVTGADPPASTGGEDELAGLTTGGGYEGPGRSPDRTDALVWAMTELMLGEPQAEPRIRLLSGLLGSGEHRDEILRYREYGLSAVAKR